MGNLQSASQINNEKRKVLQKLYDLNREGLIQLLERLRVYRNDTTLHEKSILNDPHLAEVCYQSCIELQENVITKLQPNQVSQGKLVSSFLQQCYRDIQTWKVDSQEISLEDNNYDKKTKISYALKLFDLPLDASSLNKNKIQKAYHKKARLYHPDRNKNKSSTMFDKITNAYLYLIEIVSSQGNANFISLKNNSNDFIEKQTKNGVKNTKMKHKQGQFNVKEFNQMFSKYRLEQPEDRGYEDWIKETKLKDDSVKTSKYLQGGFTKNRFNDAFEKEGEEYKEMQIMEYTSPQERFASGSMNVQELGVDTIKNFTGNSGNIQYTDYREAHTNTRCIQPKQIQKSMENRPANISQIKSQRTIIQDYNENEWNTIKKEETLKKQEQERRIEVQDNFDRISSKHYDSIHNRMLENVWK